MLFHSVEFVNKTEREENLRASSRMMIFLCLCLALFGNNGKMNKGMAMIGAMCGRVTTDCCYCYCLLLLCAFFVCVCAHFFLFPFFVERTFKCWCVGFFVSVAFLPWLDVNVLLLTIKLNKGKSEKGHSMTIIANSPRR